MKTPTLTTTQRAALEWLPADGSWRRDVHNMQSRALEYLESKNMAIEIGSWYVPKIPIDDGLQGWIWRITPAGEAIRKELNK